MRSERQKYRRERGGGEQIVKERWGRSMQVEGGKAALRRPQETAWERSRAVTMAASQQHSSLGEQTPPPPGSGERRGLGLKGWGGVSEGKRDTQERRGKQPGKEQVSPLCLPCRALPPEDTQSSRFSLSLE